MHSIFFLSCLNTVKITALFSTSYQSSVTSDICIVLSSSLTFRTSKIGIYSVIKFVRLNASSGAHYTPRNFALHKSMRSTRSPYRTRLCTPQSKIHFNL